MWYSYKIENLDCPNCALEIERAIRKVDGVKTCTVSFMALKMKVETANQMDDTMLNKIQKTIKRVESNVKIKEI